MLLSNDVLLYSYLGAMTETDPQVFSIALWKWSV
jgi:hypothetical protein